MAPPSFARIAIARIARSLASAANVSSLSLIFRDRSSDDARRRVPSPSALIRASHHASRATMRHRFARLFDDATGDETTRVVASTARVVSSPIVVVVVVVVVGRFRRLARVTSG